VKSPIFLKFIGYFSQEKRGLPEAYSKGVEDSDRMDKLDEISRSDFCLRISIDRKKKDKKNLRGCLRSTPKLWEESSFKVPQNWGI